MKPVAFQSTLDVYDFCADQVQKKLKVSRDKFIAEEEERIAMKLKGSNPSVETVKTENDVEMNDVENDEDLKAALALSLKNDTEVMEIEGSVGPGLPSNFQGKYELFAVVTHKGRDADGGHYMSWVKAEHHTHASTTEEEHDDWFVFDDDEVSPCKTEDILKLKGGGDWHIAYLCFYRAKQ
jgi:ubiquitin carboxyl-terminal hydrolase 14